MDKVVWGLIFGLAFGILDVLIMLPIKFENKRKKNEAFTSAFIERFMIGFLIPTTTLGINPIITGLILGVGLSIPSAIITRAYVPIITIGVLAGLVIGFLTNILVY